MASPLDFSGEKVRGLSMTKEGRKEGRKAIESLPARERASRSWSGRGANCATTIKSGQKKEKEEVETVASTVEESESASVRERK